MTRATRARLPTGARRSPRLASASSANAAPMKASQFFISTLKEAPADAEVASHQLMMRAGLIKQLGAGIYTYMPMGLRVIRKVESDRARGDEPRRRRRAADAGGAAGRAVAGERAASRSTGPSCCASRTGTSATSSSSRPAKRSSPTSRARSCAATAQLPKNLYQIQTKFRDERRPRFGVMRGREFMMKDAYSFDRDLDAARTSYDAMYARLRAHLRAPRPALPRRRRRHRRDRRRPLARVPGDRRHRRGRDRLLPRLRLRRQHRAGRGARAGRAARARRRRRWRRRRRRARAPARTSPRFSACRCRTTVKSLVLATDAADEAGDVARAEVWLLLVRGDHELNEIKAGKLPGLTTASASPPPPRSRRTSAASPATSARSARSSR